jgi:hypothetical protein
VTRPSSPKARAKNLPFTCAPMSGVILAQPSTVGMYSRLVLRL